MKQLNINEATSTNQNLVEVLQNYGIEFDSEFNMTNLEFLNKGAHSKIFTIKNTDDILKISDQPFEFHAAELVFENKEVLHRYFSIPIIIAPINYNFYTEQQLKEITYQNDDFEENDYLYIDNYRYYLIYKKLHLIENSHRKLFRRIEHFVESANLENYFALEDIKDWFIKEEIENKNLYQDIDYHYFIDWLIEAHKLLVKYNLTDVHDDNIMLDDYGNFKIIDVQLDKL